MSKTFLEKEANSLIAVNPQPSAAYVDLWNTTKGHINIERFDQERSNVVVQWNNQQCLK